MKNVTLIIIALIFVSVTAPVFSQEPIAIEGWKQKTASPTYGLAFMPMSISGEGEGFCGEFWIPGIDLRIFNGTNVSKRGGFYTGVEAGMLFFFPMDEESMSFSDTIDGTDETPAAQVYPYTVSMDYMAAQVFLLAKYGYRIDLGFKFLGISLGAELGIGASIGAGHMSFQSTIDGVYGDAGFGTTSTFLSVVLDAAVEAAVRLGQNLRFIARFGAMLTPPIMDNETSDYWNYDSTRYHITEYPDGSIEGWGDVHNILSRYDVEFSPPIISARVGFILNY
jgi:hypothetical protein